MFSFLFFKWFTLCKKKYLRLWNMTQEHYVIIFYEMGILYKIQVYKTINNNIYLNFISFIFICIQLFLKLFKACELSIFIQLVSDSKFTFLISQLMYILKICKYFPTLKLLPCEDRLSTVLHFSLQVNDSANFSGIELISKIFQQ